MQNRYFSWFIHVLFIFLHVIHRFFLYLTFFSFRSVARNVYKTRRALFSVQVLKIKGFHKKSVDFTCFAALWITFLHCIQFHIFRHIGKTGRKRFIFNRSKRFMVKCAVLCFFLLNDKAFHLFTYWVIGIYIAFSGDTLTVCYQALLHDSREH